MLGCPALPRPVFSAFSSLLMMAALVGPLTAQEPTQRYTEEEQVTAIDLVATAQNVTGAVPSKLESSAFRVEEEGKGVPVVSVGRLGASQGAEPWRVVLYFDLALASKGTVQAVALQLGEHADRLTRLGSVEVIVADPLPQLLLPATRDRGELEAALGGLVLQPVSSDALGEVRRTAVAAVAGKPLEGAGGHGQLPAGIGPLEVGQAAVEEESEIIERSLAGLLSWAADNSQGGPRALLWVGSGFDLDPASFHQKYLEANQGALRTERPLPAMVGATAQALAGYGWTVFPLAFADLAPAKEKPSAQFEEFRQRALFGPSSFGAATPLIQVPVRTKAKPVEVPLFTEPTRPLASLAEESGGRVVARAQELDGLLDSLERSFRVTVQVARRLDGRLRKVAVRSERAGLTATGRSWVRSGAPEALSEARVRRIRAGEMEVGDLALAARLTRAENAAAGAIEGNLSLLLDLARRGSRPASAGKSLLRLTLAYGKEDGPPSFEHRLLADQDLLGTSWSHEEAIRLPAGTEWLLVLLEDLASGSWGARDVEP